MKNIYFLRHAKAEPGNKDLSDPDRPLAARGREACAAMGHYMQSKNYIPAFALASPSARTRETLALINEAARMHPKQRFENTLYLASPETILSAIHTLEEDIPSAMVVGHNPGMHHICLLLSNRDRSGLRTTLELKYPTCALAVLRFDCKSWEAIAPGQGTLVDFITPEEL